MATTATPTYQPKAKGQKPKPPGLSFEGTESKTKQSFKDECNINNIMAKYIRTGVLPQGSRTAAFGDFSSGEEFRDVLDKVATVEHSFGQLSSDIRTRFENDPSKLLSFLQDEKNAQEAIDLGLVDAPAAEDEVAPVEAVNSPPEGNEGS